MCRPFAEPTPAARAGNRCSPYRALDPPCGELTTGAKLVPARHEEHEHAVVLAGVRREKLALLARVLDRDGVPRLPLEDEFGVPLPAPRVRTVPLRVAVHSIPCGWLHP